MILAWPRRLSTVTTHSVFGEAFAKSSLKEFSDSRSIGAKLGFSVKW